MSRWLIVGPVEVPERVRAIERRLRALGVDATAFGRPVLPRAIELPWFASVLRLRDAVSEAEGLRGIAATVERTRFPTLPYAPLSIWIPTELGAPIVPLEPTKLSPVFLGSALALVRELDGARILLEPTLGPFPDAPDLDDAGDVRIEAPPLDRVEDLKLAWRALRQAARAAIVARTALFGFPADRRATA